MLGGCSVDARWMLGGCLVDAWWMLGGCSLSCKTFVCFPTSIFCQYVIFVETCLDMFLPVLFGIV